MWFAKKQLICVGCVICKETAEFHQSLSLINKKFAQTSCHTLCRDGVSYQCGFFSWKKITQISCHILCKDVGFFNHFGFFMKKDHPNVFSHCLQGYVFKFKLAVLIKALLHMEQANGFSPVWVLSCTFKLPLWLKGFSHLEQANGFSPVWVLSCSFKWALF